jgi:hypothetical protein
MFSFLPLGLWSAGISETDRNRLLRLVASLDEFVDVLANDVLRFTGLERHSYFSSIALLIVRLSASKVAGVESFESPRIKAAVRLSDSGFAAILTS